MYGWILSITSLFGELIGRKLTAEASAKGKVGVQPQGLPEVKKTLIFSNAMSLCQSASVFVCLAKTFEGN